MPRGEFHDKPYDEGTLSKLKIFELYTQEWIPVFLSRQKPAFDEIHVFDFFSGPGMDSAKVLGSPLRILNQFRKYQSENLASWDKVKKVVHLFDSNHHKVKQLASILEQSEWRIKGVEADLQPLEFHKALTSYQSVLTNPRAAKLLIIDQCGVGMVSDEIFHDLISFPTTDFIFFLSSSTFHRFRDHPAIKQKIDHPESSYDVHREAFNYYKKLVEQGDQVLLGRFSIKKPRGNIYGLIFGSRHPLGIHKFLEVAWKTDSLAGEANFDIERENVGSGELLLPFNELRPNKIREFESELKTVIKSGKIRNEADIVSFCIEAGMTCKHSTSVLKKLKEEGILKCGFRVPNVRNYYSPRTIHLTL